MTEPAVPRPGIPCDPDPADITAAENRARGRMPDPHELVTVAKRLSNSARRCDQRGYLILAPGQPDFDQSGYVVISRTLLWKLQEAIGIDTTTAHVRRPDSDPAGTAELIGLLRSNGFEAFDPASRRTAAPDDCP